MKSDKMLEKLLRDASRAESLPADEAVPFALECRILAQWRDSAREPFSFFPLFRAALACAAAIAFLCATMHYHQVSAADEYELPSNYTVNLALAR
jgi:hypothetical protein